MRRRQFAVHLEIRNQRQPVVDGPFAETKEIIVGFNLIDAEDMDGAVRVEATFPWARTGCVGIRPVQDIASIRSKSGRPDGAANATYNAERILSASRRSEMLAR